MLTKGRNYVKLVTENEIEQIREAVFHILETSGVGIPNRKILDKLEKRGCKIDFAKERVFVDRELFKMIEECALQSSRSGESSELISRRYNRYIPSKQPSVVRRPLPDGFKLGRNITGVYEDRTGGNHLALLQDVKNFTKALHMMPEVTHLAPMIVANDIPPEVEPVVSMAETMKLTDKPFAGIEIMLPGQLPFIEELHTIYEGQQVKYTHSFASMTKFTLDSKAAQCMVEVAERNGLEQWGTNSCPIAGISSPVTIAGSVAYGIAEMMGGWIAGWALNENVVLCAVPVSATLDMRSLKACFSSPEAVLIDSAIFQVIDYLYGISVHLENSATYIDGKIPGSQTFYDKCFKSLAYFSYTGVEVGSHYGMLDTGTMISPAQLMLDFDIDKSMWQLTRGVPVNANELAIETIDKVGVSGDFLLAEHTLENFRYLFHPEILDRTAYEENKEKEKEKDVFEKAILKYEKALNNYIPVNKNEDVIREIDGIVTKAKKTLL